jgi:hypothetical protein
MRPRPAGLLPLLAAGAAVGGQEKGVSITVMDAATGKPLPSRIHLRDAAGKVFQAPGAPSWDDHFVCPGEVRIDLPKGDYVIIAERGPEFSTEATLFKVPLPAPLKIELRRLADLASEGWWSGDLHVHRPLEEIEPLLRAEDLHVAPVITWWNENNPWAERGLDGPLLVPFDGNRFYHRMAGEDEREGGALLYFNLARPLAITEAGKEHPSMSHFLEEARRQAGVHVDIEKPFWWDVPAWLASGSVDSIGRTQTRADARAEARGTRTRSDR